jgi:Transposase DDE domain
MIGPVHIEVALAAGYSGFLVIVAAGLEWFGRHSHRRSEQFRTAGFKYHGHLDVWECPCGHHLRPHYRDPVREVVRYRAPAHTCNACARKNECTDSNHGREIIHSSESWIETEAGKFHRVLSLTLLLLAALIMIAEMLRHPTFPEVLLPGSVLALVLTKGLSLARELLAKQNREGSESVRAAFGSRRI